MAFLEVHGRELRDGDGRKIVLRGVNLGGWLNMENFITGFTGTEQELRRAIREELGEERGQAFFRGFLESFMGEADLAFLAGLGANSVRLPFNYRHLEDDERPGELRPDAFRLLDQAIAWAKKHGLWVILDLHAAPGSQNEGWHSDNAVGTALLWLHPHFRDRVRDLWVRIAERYRDEPAVAGYNLINEPNAPTLDHLNRAYREWTAAIRAVDRRHVVFLEGNAYSVVFDGLDEPFDGNTVYSSHNYSLASFRARRYPGPVGGVHYDRARHEADLLRQNRWLLEREVPAWVGEFGPIFDGPVDAPTAADEARLRVLADQLDVFNQHGHHWCYWTYKDMGAMGLAVPAPDAEYVRRVRPFQEKKEALGLDAWISRRSGPLDTGMRALVDRVVATFGDYSLDLDALKRRLTNTGVYGILAGAVLPFYAQCFARMSAEELERMQRESFTFERCRQRAGLVDVLRRAMA
jgi:aryl-phospho-beta-D-glucosidase BglC (GH1 family)